MLPWARVSDTARLHELFNPPDIASIMFTLLIETLSEDCQIWNHSNDGVYTVKSDYMLFMDKLSNIKNLTIDGDWSML